MNYELFKAILAKSNQRILLVSVLLLVIGTPMAIGSYFANNNKAGWVISIIFLLLGILVLNKALKDKKAINDDTLPLLAAIRRNQNDFLVWIYQKEITSKVEGVKVGKSNNIVVYTNQNKLIEIVLTKKSSPSEVIDYLSHHFPTALVGFSDENQQKFKLLLKK